MTPQYILTKSLCRDPHCYSARILGQYVDRKTAETMAQVLGLPTIRAEYWRQLLQHASSEIENVTFARDYSESGYSTPQKGILFGNWNYFSHKVSDLLEAYGYSLEWRDEWTTCNECGKAVRTSPDCYSWQRAYVTFEETGDEICLDCVDWREYLESIEDDSNRAVMAACDPEQHGYRRVSESAEYESGFHPGQNDNPHEILKRLQAQGKEHIIFRVSETSQFYATFETWERVPVYEPDPDNVRWNRFDICLAWYVYACESYKTYEQQCEILSRLERIAFKPGLTDSSTKMLANWEEHENALNILAKFDRFTWVRSRGVKTND